MLRHVLPLVIILGIAAPLTGAAAPIELKSVNLDLPESDRMFPDGPGADAINNNCLACHSAGMVLNQPAMSKDAWKSEVNKMINNYKAPVASEDVATIVEYLVAFGGKK
jgi:hypothetical protein